MYRIMIVEDDEKISTILQEFLARYGFDAYRTPSFNEITQELERTSPDLVLLDINLPYYDGYYWCRQIRSRSNVPIIFISARAGEMDQVMAIENGGDDYVTKPIHLDLLMAKVKSVLRRAYGEYAPSTTAGSISVVEASGLKLYLNRNELEWNEERVELTKNEQLLAGCLLEAAGEVISRDKLLEALWDDVQFVDDNTLTVNVTRLRKKLDGLGLEGAIETVRGIGYKLNIHSTREGRERR
ncbi:response regulator [Paenibacillus sp. GCM10023252]|uniref:response regulator n=1 Tax=Paenibacillus sp. GCM10023252 TaxID=3252649 RepID=UPI003618D595